MIPKHAKFGEHLKDTLHRKCCTCRHYAPRKCMARTYPGPGGAVLNYPVEPTDQCVGWVEVDNPLVTHPETDAQ